MIPVRIDASPRMSRITLLFMLLSGILIFDQCKNIFSSRDSIPGMKSARNVMGLIRLVNHGKPEGRNEAVEVLGEIGDSGVFELLIAALKNNDNSGVRWKASVAIGEIGDPRTVGPRIRALADKYEKVRSEAAPSFAARGKPASEPLLRLLKFSDGPARPEVVTAPGELRDTDAIKPLILVLRNTGEDERKALADAHDAILLQKVEHVIRKLRNGAPQKNNKNRSGYNDGGEGFHG